MTLTISKSKWRDAYAIIWGIPDGQLGLACYYFDSATNGRKESERHIVTRGTIACPAGYLAAHPTWSDGIIGAKISAGDAAHQLCVKCHNVFAPRNNSIYDLRIPDPRWWLNPTDKEIALFRILQKLGWDPTDAWNRVAADTELYQVTHEQRAVCDQSA